MTNSMGRCKVLRRNHLGRRLGAAVGVLLFLLGLACAVGPARPAAAGASAAPNKPEDGKAGAPDAPKKQYALLVGCTKYQNVPDRCPELWGPANDVPQFAALLHKQFEFPNENIKQLVGWDDAGTRASKENIAAGFKDLIDKADADTQIVVLFSGHGTTAPIIHPTKEQLGKANELLFLPLDVKPWENDQIPNAVTEDELRDWLNQLRDKKASVLVVFDCCHAGSMARGTGEVRLRAVKPQDLGIPNTVIEAATERAKNEIRKAPPPPTGERSRGLELLPAGLNLSSSPPGGKGSVTAIYACQPFETAPEMRIPPEKPDTPENYFGLLSYTVTEVLTRRQGESPLTYRELQRLMVAKYQEKQGSRGPTPFIDGDLDREVLGRKVWPGRSALVLKRKEDKLFVNAGALMGLTPESILAVHPPDPRDAKTVLGYVQVTKDVEPAEAGVRPCEYPAGKPAVTADKLPADAVCQVVERSVGDFRVKVAVAKPRPVGKDDKEAEARNKRLANVSAAVAGLRQEVKGLIQVVDSEADAGWVLDVEGDQVLLKQGIGVTLSDEAKRKAMQEAAKERERNGQPEPPNVFGGYGADDVKALTRALEVDLQKIFAWENLWRVADSQPKSTAASPGTGLEGDLLRRTNDDKPGDKVLSGAVVQPGDKTLISLVNNTTDNQWIFLVFLNSDFSIDVVPRAVKVGKPLEVKTKIAGTTFGREGVVVLAFPQQQYAEAPDLDFLKQEPLHQASRSIDEKKRDVDRGPDTPFGALMKAAVFGTGKRSTVVDEPSNPTVLSWSWTTVPKP